MNCGVSPVGFRVRHGAGISVGTVVFRALGVKLLTHFVTCICIVSGIESNRLLYSG